VPILTLVVLALALAGRAHAATIAVTTTAQLQNTFSPTCSTSVSPCAHNGDTVAIAGSATAYAPTATVDVTVSVTIAGPTTTPGATLTGASVVADPTSGADEIFDTEPGTTVAFQSLTLTNAPAAGAAVGAFGAVTITGSTVSGDQGDGIWVDGGGTITNSTFAGNGTNAAVDANGGSGIVVDSALTLQNDTITGNGDHGIANVVLGGSALVTMNNTIAYGNGSVTGGGDCAMPPDSSDDSLDGDSSCAVALSGTNPLLGPLAANGGPTQTEALAAASPAVNAGDNAVCPAADQRGVPRNDLSCDIGAYEYVDTAQPVISLPAGITVGSTSPSGAVVDFSSQVGGSDPDGDAVTVTCTPPPGSVFPIGQTTVSCTARDTHNRTASGSFVVTVTNSGGGAACRADGKVDGRGGTLAAKAFAALLTGYQNDVCGKVSDANGTAMALFDYDSLTGSDLGVAGASCRTDAFAGSDVPYTQATLAQLDGAPGAVGCAALAGVTPPYAPSSGTYPAPGDTAAPIMAFPIAGTSVAIGIDLQASDCGGTKPTAILLTASMLSRLLSGDIRTWDDSGLRASGQNAALANCHVPVTRVVRLDASQTTQNLKNYLVHADNNRTTAIHCFTGGKWAPYANPVFNTTWPGDNGTNCSALDPPSSAGDTAQLALCASTSGAICYADLPSMTAQPTLIRPSIRNAADTAYAAPATVSGANCSFAAMSLPLGAGGAVGLNTSDSWATDNPAGNHGDVTFIGSAYPICELTFGLVYSGLRAGGTAVSALSFDQRVTLASFFTYVLEPTAQSRLLGGSFLSPLPSPILDSLRAAFQAAD
jgi:hypothetical protein